jgi:hypothetical protein
MSIAIPTTILASRATGGRIVRMETDDALLEARARVLADLTATRLADAHTVSLLESALATRRWWASEWPEGASYVAGQVAQDVQDALFDAGTARWPLCHLCPPDAAPEHELRITPELGPAPTWLCERTGVTAAALGALPGGGN